MIDKIPSSLQKLITLSDISSAQKPVKDEDYFQLKRDYQNLVNAVTAMLTAINGGEFSPIIGIGSPEGVVTSNHSLQYIDENTNQQYYNPTYGASTGWIAL
jgi:hypothetical protein